MSLRYAILGLLTFEPMSGYTLKTRYFDRSIAHFWPADQAQIYRTLQAVERDGLATCDTVESDGRPDSRVYSITEAGRHTLLEWLAQVQKVPIQRDGIGPALLRTLIKPRADAHGIGRTTEQSPSPQELFRRLGNS